MVGLGLEPRSVRLPAQGPTPLPTSRRMVPGQDWLWEADQVLGATSFRGVLALCPCEFGSHGGDPEIPVSVEPGQWEAW